MSGSEAQRSQVEVVRVVVGPLIALVVVAPASVLILVLLSAAPALVSATPTLVTPAPAFVAAALSTPAASAVAPSSDHALEFGVIEGLDFGVLEGLGRLGHWMIPRWKRACGMPTGGH